MRKLQFVQVLLCLLFYSSALFSQSFGIFPRGSTFEVEGKKLIVVIDDTEEDNKELIQVMPEVLKSEWTLTPFEVITVTDFEKNKTNYTKSPNNIFLGFNNYKVHKTVGAGIAGKLVTDRDFIMGYKIKDNGKVARAGNVVYLMSYPAELTTKAGLVRDINTIKGFILAAKSKTNLHVPAKSIMEKTLYINREHIGDHTDDDIKKFYPYKFKIVDKDEYSQAILDKKPDVVFFEYTRGDAMPDIFVLSMNEPYILWHETAKGVNKYVHYNFRMLANKLKKE